MKYWICKAKYKQETPDGKLRPATYEIIIESSGYTESEAGATQMIREALNTDFDSLDIKPSRFTEIIRDPGEILLPWFKATVHLLGYDEEKRKATNKDIYVLVQGEDIPSALEALLKHFDKQNIRSIESSSITEVYPADKNNFVPQQPVRTEAELLLERFGEHATECYNKYKLSNTSKKKPDESLLKQMAGLLGKFTSGISEDDYLNTALKLEKEYTPNMGSATAGLFPAIAIENILNNNQSHAIL